jgi:hypothetical protein
MAKTLYILLSLLFAASANAAVVDHFKCKITATRANGIPFYSGEVDAYARRMTLQAGPNATDWVSFGHIELNAAGSKFDTAGIQLNYQHAVQNGHGDKPAKARQYLCMQVSVTERGGGTASGCAVPSADAFAPDATGWDDTDMTDGVPVLKVQGLHAETLHLSHGITIQLGCEHLGTEQ